MHSACSKHSPDSFEVACPLDMAYGRQRVARSALDSGFEASPNKASLRLGCVGDCGKLPHQIAESPESANMLDWDPVGHVPSLRSGSFSKTSTG